MLSKRKKLFKMENLESEFDSNNFVSSTPLTNKKRRRMVHLYNSERSLESSSSVYFSYGSPKQSQLDCTESDLNLELKSNVQDIHKEISTDDRHFDLDCNISNSIDASFDFSVDDNYTSALEKCIPENIRNSHIYSKNDPMANRDSSDFTIRDSKADSGTHHEMLQRNPFYSSKSPQLPYPSLLHENISNGISSNLNPLSFLSSSSPANINENLREKVNIEKITPQYLNHKNTTSLTAVCKSNDGSTDIDRICLGKIDSSILETKSFRATQSENVKESDVLEPFPVEYKNIQGYNQSQYTNIQSTENMNTRHSKSLFSKISAFDISSTNDESRQNISFKEINNSDLDNCTETTSKRNEIESKFLNNESSQRSETWAEDDYNPSKVPEFKRNQETSSKAKSSEKYLELSLEENIFEKCNGIKDGNSESQVATLSTIFASNSDSNKNNETRNEAMELGEVRKHTILPKTPNAKLNQEITKKESTSFNDYESQFSQILNILEKGIKNRTSDIKTQSLTPKIFAPINSNLPESGSIAVASMQFSDGFTENSTILPKTLDIESNQIISSKEPSSCCEKSANLCEDLWKQELEKSSSVGTCVDIINGYKDLQTSMTETISIENNASQNKKEDPCTNIGEIHGNISETNNLAAKSKQISDVFTGDNTMIISQNQDGQTNHIFSVPSGEKSGNSCKYFWEVGLKELSISDTCANIINVDKDSQTLEPKNNSVKNNNASYNVREDSDTKIEEIHGNLSETNNPAAKSKQLSDVFIDDLPKNLVRETNHVFSSKAVSSCSGKKSGTSCKYFWEVSLEESSTSDVCADTTNVDKDSQTLETKNQILNNISRDIVKDSYLENQEHCFAKDAYIFPNVPDSQQNQKTASKQSNGTVKEFSPEKNIFEKCNEVMNVDRESQVSTVSTVHDTNSNRNENSETRGEDMELGEVEKDIILPKFPTIIQNQDISKPDNYFNDNAHVLSVSGKYTEDRTADIETQSLAPNFSPTVSCNLYKSRKNTSVKSVHFSDGLTENSTIIPKNLHRETSQVILNEDSSSFGDKLDNSRTDLWKSELENSSLKETRDNINHDKDSHALVEKSISLASNKVKLRKRGYSYKEMHGNNLALNEKGLYCISKPKADIRILIDLFEADNDVSKRILLALSQEFIMKGVTQTEMLNFLRRDAKPGTVTKLKQDIGIFLKAAVNAEIIEKKNRRYYLKLKSRSYKSDRSPLKELITEKSEIFTSVPEM